MQNVSLEDEFPDAVMVERLPLTFHVRFAKQDGVCQTLEGAVAYLAGAALITGSQGEQWPVESATFFASYTPASDVVRGEDGLYIRLPQRLMAHQLSAPIDVALPEGRGILHGRAGDWLVERPSGDRAIVAAEIFPKTYRAIGKAEA